MPTCLSHRLIAATVVLSTTVSQADDQTAVGAFPASDSSLDDSSEVSTDHDAASVRSTLSATPSAVQYVKPTKDTQPRSLEVVVRGERPGLRGTVMESMDRTMLERVGAGANNVAETLDRLPSMASGSGSRGERIVSLRGFDQRQIIVTLDGVPIHVPYDGRIDLGKFPIGLVDRVTIVKGSGLLLFGPNGLGGAVDIASRRPGEWPPLVLSTETSPFYTQRFSPLASVSIGRIALLAGASFEQSHYFPLAKSFVPTFNEDGGRRENSDRKSYTVVAKARWEIDDHNDFSVGAWSLAGEYGTPPGVFDLTRRFWRWRDWHIHTYSITHAYQSGYLMVDETAYVSFLGNTLDSFDNDLYNSQVLPASGTSVYDDGMVGGFWRISYGFACRGGRCVTARGWLGVRRDWHTSTNGPTSNTTKVATTTTTVAGQLDGTLANDRIRWHGGIQADAEIPSQSSQNASPNRDVDFGPMGAITWQPHQTTDISASVARRTRFPTLRERYSSAFGTMAPNPSLGAEHATNTSLDAVVRLNRYLRVEAGGFESELTRLVTQIPVDVSSGDQTGDQTSTGEASPIGPNGRRLQWQNAGRARIFGFELSARSSPAFWLDLWAGWAITKTRLLDIREKTDAMPYRPDQKATISATVRPFNKLSITAVGRYTGRQRFQNTDTLHWGTLGGFFLIDTRLDVEPVDGLRLWVRGANLADANVQAHYSFPEPGRQLFLGASFEGPPQRNVDASR